MSSMKRALVVLAIGVLPIFGSCIFNAEEAPPDTVIPPVAFRPLDKRDNILFNLELAYNQRDIDEFRKLIDSDGAYIFFFSPTDVSEGNVQNSQWGYDEEALATGRLFDKTPPAAGEPHADKIALDLIYTEAEGDWQEFVSSRYPSETWYQKTIEYTIRVKVGDTEYNQNRTIVAMIAVRQAPGEIWEIVEWRDDIGN